MVPQRSSEADFEVENIEASHRSHASLPPTMLTCCSQRLGLLETSEKLPEHTSSPKPSRAFWTTGGRHSAIGRIPARSSTGSRRGEIPSFGPPPVPDARSERDIGGDDDAVQDDLSPRTSVSSVFGSIRKSIGRVGSQKHSRISTDTIPEQEGSECMRRPTSPIPIPKSSNAPTLPLDFLGHAFSPNFDLSTTKSDIEENRKLMDPDNITLGIPATSVFPSAIQVATARESCPRPARISIDEAALPSATPGPPTPLPGTNAPMDMDGHSSTDIPVFERSVETSDSSPGHKTLRPAPSIDAMTSAREGSQRNGTGSDQLKLETSRLLAPLTEASRVSSACTISTIPPDMKPLTPQITPNSRREPDHGDTEKWQSAIHREVSAAPPSTPLITPLGADQAEVHDLDFPIAALDNFDLTRAPSPDKSVQLAIRSRADSIQNSRAADSPIETSCRVISPSEIPMANDGQESPSPPLSGSRVLVNRTASPASTHSNEPILRKDYEEFKTRHLFGDNSKQADPPTYEEAADSTSRRDSSSPLFWPTELPPSVFDDSDSSISAAASMDLFDSADSPKHQHSSSPRNHINTSAVGLIKSYWGTLESRNWLGEIRRPGSDQSDAVKVSTSRDEPPTAATPGVPCHDTYRSSDSSDGFDSDDLMGGRGRFERTRAERNARYNSLPQFELLKRQTSSPLDSSPPKPCSPGQSDDVFEDTPARSVHTNFIRFGSSSLMKADDEDEEKENTPVAAGSGNDWDKLDSANGAPDVLKPELSLCQMLGLPERLGDDWPLQPQGLELPDGRSGELEEEEVGFWQELERRKGELESSLEGTVPPGLVRGHKGPFVPRK